MFKELRHSGALGITLAAAGILMVTMGARQSMGLFLGPLNTSTGLGIVTISFAMAVAQFTWGAVQPLAGAAADRWGPRPVLVAGILILALGTALTPLLASAWGLMFTIGLLSAMGAGAGSFSVLIGAAAQRMPAQSRGAASGVINAGGSFGQFVFAPLAQKLIQLLGWMGAMWSMAAIALLALPLVGKVTGGAQPPSAAAATAPAAQDGEGLGRAVWLVMREQNPTLFWRSRHGNPVNGFYDAESDGCIKQETWKVFWYGLSAMDEIASCVAYCASHAATLKDPE